MCPGALEGARGDRPMPVGCAPGISLPIQNRMKMDGGMERLAGKRYGVTIAEAAKATGASRNTIKDHVPTLTDCKHLTRHGAARGAWYGPG